MTYQEQYEKLIEKFINRKRLSISTIQKEGRTGFRIAKAIYQEYLNYHDEIYWHNAIYEISFMGDIPTPARIMNKFKISYYFANKLFNYYMEIANG
jgi:hypothetical protein